MCDFWDKSLLSNLQDWYVHSCVGAMQSSLKVLTTKGSSKYFVVVYFMLKRIVNHNNHISHQFKHSKCSKSTFTSNFSHRLTNVTTQIFHYNLVIFCCIKVKLESRIKLSMLIIIDCTDPIMVCSNWRNFMRIHN